MAKQEAVTPLETMLGEAADFPVNGKNYKVMPLLVKDNNEFNELYLGPQYFTINNPEDRKKLEKFMPRYLFNEADEPMTVDKIGEDGWSVADITRFLKKVIQVSG
jgi:hypothetical protein